MRQQMIQNNQPQSPKSQKIISPSTPYLKQLKIDVFLLGEKGVGKTTCLIGYLRNILIMSSVLNAFMGLKLQNKTISKRSVKINFDLWNTNIQSDIQDQLKKVIDNQIHKQKHRIRLGLIFFDVSNIESFLKVKFYTKLWMNYCPQQLKSLILVANKIDLRQKNSVDNSQCVSAQSGLQLAKQLKILYVQSSSKYDVSQIFQRIALNLAFSQLDVKFKEIQVEQMKIITNLEKKLVMMSWKEIILRPFQCIKQLIYLMKQNNNKGKKLMQILFVNYQRVEKIGAISTINFSINFYQNSFIQNISQDKDQNYKSNTQPSFQVQKILKVLNYLKQMQQSKIQQLSTKIIQFKKQNQTFFLLKLDMKQKLKKCQQGLSQCQKFYQNDLQEVLKGNFKNDQLILEDQSLNIKMIKQDLQIQLQQAVNSVQIISRMVLNVSAYKQRYITIFNQILQSLINSPPQKYDYQCITNLIGYYIESKRQNNQQVLINPLKNKTPEQQLQDTVIFLNKTFQQLNKIEAKVDLFIVYYKDIKDSIQLRKQIKMKLQIEKHNLEMLRVRQGLKRYIKI